MKKPLTAEDLKVRGSCCGIGCTNCPYIPRHARGAVEVIAPTDKPEREPGP